MSTKPSLKLTLSTAGLGKASSIGTPTPNTATATPRIKFSSKAFTSKPSASVGKATNGVQKSKAGRPRKPSSKVVEAKLNGKRNRDESDSNEDLPLAKIGRPTKTLRLSLGGPKTPVIVKPKFKGKPPKRPLGEGYDSEASDREIDPQIEEQFVLRMMPGDDCAYLRAAIENRAIGLPKSQGGADVQMKFFDGDGRRAAITVCGRHYAATLVDLPCIVEGMKSWDKRGWWKSADICQMLYVYQPVEKEEMAKTVDLPKMVDPKTFQYPHGLTPPMHFARKRRFRKRISRNAIEAVEDAVEKLLAADDQAEETRFEIVDPDKQRSTFSPGSSPEYGGYDNGAEYSHDEDDDAEGDVDDMGYFDNVNGNGNRNEAMDEDIAADLEAEMEAALFADDDIDKEASEGADVAAVAPTMSANGTDFPAANEASPAAVDSNVEHDFSGVDESSDAEGDDDDADAEGDDDDIDDDDGDADEIDEDERVRLEELQGKREDIADMEAQLAKMQATMDLQTNPILKKRIRDNIDKIKEELQLKKSALGGDED